MAVKMTTTLLTKSKVLAIFLIFLSTLQTPTTLPIGMLRSISMMMLIYLFLERMSILKLDIGFICETEKAETSSSIQKTTLGSMSECLKPC